MKTAVKVFLIISIVSASLCILLGIVLGSLFIGMRHIIADGMYIADEYYDDFDDDYYDSDDFIFDDGYYYDDDYFYYEYDEEYVDVEQIVAIAESGLIIVGVLMLIVYGAIGGVQLGLSIAALKKLNGSKCSADFSTGWRVVVLLFVNLIAGILLLCMKDKDFAEIKTDNGGNAYTVDDLFKYKELLDAGAITQQEYDEIKSRVLGKDK
ncbi:MAG: SHOCT domain-containing protein [Ruminococcaceae bacterium]|nr:SHOCT domain-containing protein [Oscillospiraceae bacterium]